jgi:hypothetical protein
LIDPRKNNTNNREGTSSHVFVLFLSLKEYYQKIYIMATALIYLEGTLSVHKNQRCESLLEKRSTNGRNMSSEVPPGKGFLRRSIGPHFTISSP